MAESGLESGPGRNLWKWFTQPGEAGADEIGWGSAGDYDRCVTLASQHVPANEVHGMCQTMHINVTGMTTSQHAAMEGK